jgi:hypothetical protein
MAAADAGSLGWPVLVPTSASVGAEGDQRLVDWHAGTASLTQFLVAMVGGAYARQM